MPRNEINYMQLGQKILKTSYRLSDVRDKIEKVGFDIVRFKDNDEDARLWQVHSTDDGDYIVALYNGEDDKVVESSWKVTLNKIAKTLSFYYKESPIVKVEASKLGIPEDELNKAVTYLPEKLSTNKKLMNALLKELSLESRSAVLAKHPELKV